MDEAGRKLLAEKRTVPGTISLRVARIWFS
jgi:hypothetical protein